MFLFLSWELQNKREDPIDETHTKNFNNGTVIITLCVFSKSSTANLATVSFRMGNVHSSMLIVTCNIIILDLQNVNKGWEILRKLMLAKVDTVDNYCPELQVTQTLKMVIQVGQCCFFLYEEHKEAIMDQNITFETIIISTDWYQNYSPCHGQGLTEGFWATKIVINCTWSMMYYTVYERKQTLAW